MYTNSFANYLVTNNIFSEENAREIAANAKQEGVSLVGYLIKHKLLTYKAIAKYVSSYFDLPLINLVDLVGKDLPLALVDKELVEKYQILPIACEQKQLQLAIADPSASQIINEIKFHTNLEIKLVVAEFDKLTRLISEVLHQQRYDTVNPDDPHIIDLIDQVISDAITKEASDIHFEPYNDFYRIRFRIDGLLYQILNPDTVLASQIIARLKIMANLDIAEHRLPQDGRFSFQEQDCRISTCPTLYGEKIVIRILNPEGSILKINALGLETQQLELFANAMHRPQGLILVTGPTGSGKTISLYAALQELNSIHKNISSVEDPVEINLSGINQVHVNPKIGLDFAAALRTFLRQDPDIIMVGEIRDTETAEIAVKAAQTGHLVLSTLHTNNTAESVMRLLNMRIAPYNLHSTLVLIVAQRLVRKLCSLCKREQQLPPEILLQAGFKSEEIAALQIYEAVGCNNCFKGYKSRIGIFEILPISAAISRMILQQASVHDIAAQAKNDGVLSLREAALNKVRMGLTSLSEINRVV
jgi:type IV pilus assembly protein PilB